MIENHRSYDRRQDVGQKMFIGIVTALLTTILVSIMSLGWRNYERNNVLEIRVAQIEVFLRNQNELNKKLTDILELGIISRFKNGGVQ